METQIKEQHINSIAVRYAKRSITKTKEIILFGNKDLSDEQVDTLKETITILIGQSGMIKNVTQGNLYQTIEDSCIAFSKTIVQDLTVFYKSFTQGSSRKTIGSYKLDLSLSNITPSKMAICIGGDNQFTQIMKRICLESNIPIIGIPLYGGIGKDIYEEMMKNNKNIFPNIQIHKKEFKKLLVDLEKDISVLPEIVKNIK